jgi:ferredoxin like protein
VSGRRATGAKRSLRRAKAAGAPTSTEVLRTPAPSAYPEVSFEDRMATIDFRVAPDAHIVVDGDACNGCTTRECVVACPANLFVPVADGGILFNYEQCFECGTCYLACNTAGAISWSYPEGGHGVVFRRS